MSGQYDPADAAEAASLRAAIAKRATEARDEHRRRDAEAKAEQVRAAREHRRRVALNRELAAVEVADDAQRAAIAAMRLPGDSVSRLAAIEQAMMREAMILAKGDHAQAARLLGMEGESFTKAWRALVRRSRRRNHRS
jgi:hypothetical protein